MSLPYYFDANGLKEFRQTICWMEADRRGRGTRFQNAVQWQVDAICQQSDTWPVVSNGVRQSPIPGWRYYSIYYRVQNEYIVIVSVFHASREPKDW